MRPIATAVRGVVCVSQWVESHVERNIVKRNSRPSDAPRRTATSQPTSYALGIRGVQNVTVNRNLFTNPDMDFELLGGQVSSLVTQFLCLRPEGSILE